MASKRELLEKQLELLVQKKAMLERQSGVQVDSAMMKSQEPQRQDIKNPFVAALKSASDLIGGPFSTQYYARGGPFRHEKAMREAGEIVSPIEQAKIKGVIPQLAYGAVQAAPIMAGAANPFMKGAQATLGVGSKIPLAGKVLTSPIARSAAGFGAYEAAKAGATGQISTPKQAARTFGEGALSGALFHGGGKAGATALQKFGPLGQRVGSGLGAGGISAAMAPEGEKVSSAILGGAFGAKYPSEPYKMRKVSPEVYVKESTGIYRDILRPTQGEIKKVEIKKGRDINDFYKIAAEEGLTINQAPNNKGQKTIDTKFAREVLNEKTSQNFEQLNTVLKSDPVKRFDLNKIRNKAKNAASEKIKNAKDLETAKTEIDAEINAEIARHGTNLVNGNELNTIKQGMWSKGYNVLQPTAKDNARRIGFAAKDAIETAYPNDVIRKLNNKSGDLLTLGTLLTNAQGRVVKGGRLGLYASRGIGAIAGQSVPIVGPLAGAYVGGKVGEKIYAPEYQSKKAQKLMQKARKFGYMSEPIEGK